MGKISPEMEFEMKSVLIARVREIAKQRDCHIHFAAGIVSRQVRVGEVIALANETGHKRLKLVADEITRLGETTVDPRNARIVESYLIHRIQEQDD